MLVVCVLVFGFVGFGFAAFSLAMLQRYHVIVVAGVHFGPAKAHRLQPPCPMRTPPRHSPVGGAKPGEPGDRSQDQAAHNDRSKQGTDQRRRIGQKQGHEFRHRAADRFHIASDLGQDKGSEPVIQVEEQREGPGIPDKRAKEAGQQIATRQVGQHHPDKKMQPEKRGKGHGNTPGGPHRDRQRRSRHPLDPLYDIGKQTPKASIRPQDAANAVQPRQGNATFEHGDIRPSG